MKKIFVLAAALIGFSSIYAMEEPSRDVEMGNAKSDTFDLSDLQAAIEEVAYNKTSLTYQDFVENVFGKYSALQSDIILMQQTNHNPDFTAAITVINKNLTSLISNENFLKLMYVISIRKFHSVDEITPEIITAFDDPSLTDDQVSKNFVFTTIKAGQERRESFYKILLSNPNLNKEYKAILNGQKYDISEEFLQEITKSSINAIKKMLMAKKGITEQQLTGLNALLIEISLSQITKKIASIRAALPLIVKHFGDLGGFGLI
jgi:cell division protein ZapA (FtsZ GTPase activity inhibitor)